jgi:hypothetical protein
MILMIRTGGIPNNLANRLVFNSTCCGLDGGSSRIGGGDESEEFNCWA